MSDLSTTSWSEVDASNDQTPPEGWPAGMAPNQVEPSARMNMGAVKRFWNRVNPTYLAVLSTTDTYTITETQAPAGYGLHELRRTRFPSANTTTSPTVNHSSLGAMTLVKYNNAGSLVNLGVGDIQAQDHQYWWDGTTHMVVTNPASLILGATNKAAPTSSDSIIIADAAAGGLQKQVLFSSVVPNIFPNKASPTTADSVVLSDASAANVGALGTLANVLGLKVLHKQVFTTSGTFVTSGDANTVYKWTIVGGGGGGGGANGAGGNQAGGSGGAGATAIFYGSVANGSTVTVQVGIGGAGGSNAPGNGGAGVASNIVFNSTTVTASGGNLGNAGANASPTSGGSGGTATNGTINIPGGGGGSGGTATGAVISMPGGASSFGGGGVGVATANAGVAGGAPGSGGSGAAVGSGLGASGGGAGANGIVIVEWIQ